MLFGLIIFAVVLALLNVIASVALFIGAIKVFMSKKFIKKYTKMAVEVGNEVSKEIMDEMEEA